MNTYYKFVPGVYLAKCEEKHEKGEEIIVTTKYGKDNKHIVHNQIPSKGEHYYYSIVRSDGMNSQKYAQKRAEKYEHASENAKRKSENYFEKANKDNDFLSLGEPIKIGHHSEKRHRKMIEDANNNMQKSVDYEEKSDEYIEKSERWAEKTKEIDLSMPESIDYYLEKYEEAKEHHQKLKNGEIEREHSFSLTYAKKQVNELEKKYNLAVRLWG